MLHPFPEKENPASKLLNEALGIKDPVKRKQLIEDACGDDQELKDEVLSLLDFAELWDGYSEQATNFIGKRIGKYEVKSELGRGGMGIVYLGARTEDFNHLAAIKVLPKQVLTQESLRRFGKETRIMARLDHANLAKLIDAGVTEDKLPYVVMEYIQGQRIDEYCDQNRLSIKERLSLFCKVCSVVTYANQRGVIHRDIKPGNILVTTEGEPKLIDFGIAKVLNPTLNTLTLTNLQQRAFSPEYASPEQFRGDQNIGKATDIYSLGAVLYCLLTGRAPHKFKSRDTDEMRRVICDLNVTLPSRVVQEKEGGIGADDQPQRVSLDSISAARGCTPNQLRKTLSGDLDCIVVKAMQKEPMRRYQSAAELSADIDNYLHGRPVKARKGARRSKVENAAIKIANNLPPNNIRWQLKFSLYLLLFTVALGIWQYQRIRRWSLMGTYVLSSLHESLPKTPLFPSQRSQLIAASDRLVGHFSTEIKRNLAAHSPWESAQIVMGISDRAEVEPNKLNEYWKSTVIRNCPMGPQNSSCWAQENEVHLAASSWVLLAMSRLKLQALDGQIDFILNNQKPSGWWPIYPTPSEDGANASTYATAISVLALHEYLNSGAPGIQDTDRIKVAIERGQMWLMRNHISGRARWLDHPLNSLEASESVGLSGLVIHVLHKTNANKADLNEIDELWRENLPSLKLSATDCVTSRVMTSAGLRDHTSNYAMQWSVIATADTYQSGTEVQKAEALVWMKDIVDNLDNSVSEVTGGNTDWIAAELLISVRYLDGEGAL
jgi:serine/threonine protein kinase